MDRIPAMVDMARTPAEKEEAAEAAIPSPMNQPDYPYGLCISLTQDELDKLNLDHSDVEVGDMLHMHCMAKVTSVSKTDNEATGPQCRVELQITHIVAEDEDEEDAEAEAEMPQRRSKLYR